MKRISIIILIACTAFLSANAQNVLSLEQCVEMAIANNRNVKQQALNKNAREIAYQQARNNLLPDLNASAGQSFGFGRSLSVDNTYKNVNSTQTSFGIGANLTLFDGLKMKHNIDARKAELMASDADLDKIKEDIILSVSAAYLQVLMNKELLQIANEQLNLTNVRLEQRQSLVKSGKMPEGELFELKAQLAKEEMSRLQAENNLKLSLLDLAQVVELDDFERLDVVVPANLTMDESALVHPDVVYASAITHRPELKSAEYRLLSSEKSVLVAKSDFYPRLNLGANSGTGYYNMSGLDNSKFNQQLTDNLSSSIGFNLNIPLFNKFAIKNNVRTAQLNVESSKIDIENKRIELRKSIQQAYSNAVAAKARWDASQKSELASKEALRFVSQKYDAGRANVYELYQAQNNLTQVLSEQTQSKYEYVFRLKILELYR